MPKIEIRKTIELTLPSYPESKVILWDKLLAGDMERIMKESDDFQRGIVAVQCLIKDWNFVDDNGNKLEVNLENLKKLPLEDLTFLTEKVRDFFSLPKNLKRKS